MDLLALIVYSLNRITKSIVFNECIVKPDCLSSDRITLSGLLLAEFITMAGPGVTPIPK